MSALVPGTRLGPYEVIDSLGAGGMGEVYRATDTRLKRQVALKVLPAAVTGDADRLARFQREAEVLASLNHPNIAALFGIEEADGVKALVMELVEGATLADRLAQAPVPLAEALSIARQIAHALAAAHEQGIIHRDLKPANVKLRPDGDVKVLDFGLAKAMDPAIAASASTSASMSPTITSPAQMTAAGMILGTAAFMSPEQAAGRPVDRRTDLWAFGVVLFEMLTGNRLFDGESVSHVIAAVLKDTPDWTALPADTPAAVRKLLARCLEKDRRKRLSDAATAALECEEALASPTHADVTGVAPMRKGPAPVWPVAAAFIAGALIVAVLGWVRWPAAPTAPPSTRFAVELPSDQNFSRTGRHVLALSPDGRQLAYVANTQLYLRSFGELVAAPIDGTASSDPSEPVFSPDGKWIAFWSTGMLKKVPTDGGTPITLSDLANPYGLSWQGDRIIAAVDSPPAIVEVPANGGPSKVLLQLDADKDETGQSPQLIDGGRAVLFTLHTGADNWDSAAIVIQDITTGARTTLVERGTDGRLLEDGHLVYSRGGTLFAVDYDGNRRAVSGAPLQVQHRILQSVGGFTGASQVAFSGNGAMAYVPDDGLGGDRVLLWMTRQGQIEPTNLPARPHFAAPAALALSPDGKQVAVRILSSSGAGSDIWIADLARKVYTRLTSTGLATDPIWTPDGTRVCYENQDSLLCQPADGSAAATPVLTKPDFSTVSALSPDGASILLTTTSDKTGFDLWLAPNKPPYTATPLIASSSNDDSPAISPNGKWLAYASEESGTDEIYVRPFPAVDQGRWQVSTAGGLGPRWSKDGRELCFFATRTAGSNIALTLMAAKVQPGATFQTAPPEVVAQLPLGTRGYDTGPDGRFIISAPAGSTGPGVSMQRQSIAVVQNWPDILKTRSAATSRQ
jgi:serine/threonine-protein kinase